MIAAGSLQLFHELGTCKQYGVLGHPNQSKRSMIRTSRLHLLRPALSSHALDAWALHLSDTLHRPIHCFPSRYNIFVCRSFLTPGRANEAPILKAATLALTRSYKYLNGTPLVLQLVPAVGIIAFAVWGLGPLMRHSRNLFLHRSDSSWKKSRTYRVFTSYLQPFLLWTGATLICRVLDPVTLPSEASQAIKQRLLNFVKSLSTVLAFAYCLSSLIQQAQKFFMETNDSNDARNMGFQFAGKAVYTAVWVAAVSLFMELLGFSTQRWLTAGGLGTVLLTLAGREIFTNFLSSVMIHATRPFIVNEWIQTKIEGYEVSGTVEHVGWWSPTIIRGDDREAVHIPNHKFTVSVVRNLTQKTHWRIKTHIAISHLDVNKINNIVADMRKVLAKNPQVEQQRLHRRVFLENINPENQALLILVSCFVKTSHIEEYLCVKEAILLDLLRVVSHHRARLATPIRTVQKIYADADVDNIPFSETIFTRAGAATPRPLLLIEPPSRIHSDDRTTKARSPRANEEQVAKAVVLDSKETGSATDTSAQHASDNRQSKKAGSGDARSKSGKVEGAPSVVPASPPLPKQQLEGLDSIGEKTDSLPSTYHVKHESERSPPTPPTPPIARPALEENIVLGVALEGSKRTLPIEEGMGPTLNPAEAKELATCRNGNGSSSATAGKDKKDNQLPAVPGTASSDQRDQER
ncbi:mechanosensitive ion channel protein 2, chloroplastic-like isoform X2 [Magnolia sinica]|uniref:mechanosensitive ion channel protein 2, chloroplastic-like isoform X2 n=1 Tax=Magnolia sinica TaxID=86752 RepID=UPI0026592A2B|nr:mechanosensitive ion channel protein 2, chloroplastic-like isoform X2 [Magnolia sinica]